MKNQRRRKLINPKVQIGLSSVFAGIALLAILLQTLLFSSAMVETAEKIPTASQALLNLIPGTIARTVLVSMAVILPLTIVVGVITTFRIVGPVYRFETFLRKTLRGEQTEPCRIRKGDAFQGLCDLINQSTEHLRTQERTDSTEEAAPERLSEAA